MDTPTSRIPTLRKIFRAAFNLCARIYRAVFTWRTARRVLLGLAILATLVAIFYTEENWRGQRDWDVYKSALIAQGVPMSIEQLQPPPVPDDQNFAMAPVIQDLYDQTKAMQLSAQLDWTAFVPTDPHNYNKIQDVAMGFASWHEGRTFDMKVFAQLIGQPDMVKAMQKFAPVLDQFTAASRRPSARFPVSDDLEVQRNFNLVVFLDLSRIYALRALAELNQGQTQNAADDISIVLRLANLIAATNSLTSKLVSIGMALTAIQPIWEGLVEHRWSDVQLAQLQTDLQKLDFVAALRRGFQVEQILGNNMSEQVLTGTHGYDFLMDSLVRIHKQPKALARLEMELLPAGWVRQNQILINQDLLQRVAFFDPVRHKIDVAAANAAGAEWPRRTRTPFNFIATAFSMNLYALIQSGASDMAEIDEAVAACAIERYRLAHGKIPDKLDDLVPQFLAKAPVDVMTGGPLNYKPQADGHYLLYSVGPDGHDDEGTGKKNNDDIGWPDTARQ